MKLNLEFAVIFLISLFMLTMMVQFVGVVAMIHKGHLYLNYVVAMVEDYDGDLPKVEEHINNSTLCSICQHKFNQEENRVFVTVDFPIRIGLINYESSLKIKGLTEKLE